MRSTLLLNASYEPLSVVPSRRALQLLLTGKAVTEDPSPYKIKTASGTLINIPYVARLTYEVKRRKHVKPASFQRRGMLNRDNFLCVYCGKSGNTVDHVIPRSLGGKTSYDNCVTACFNCNHKKGNKTLEQLGWSLPPGTLTVPPKREYRTMLDKAHHDLNMFTTWIEYISWYDVTVKEEKQQLVLNLATKETVKI